jgi:urease accessory protein
MNTATVTRITTTVSITITKRSMPLEPELGGSKLVDYASLPFLRLMHLADSALPIGALAHSFGLETLVDAELLTVSGLPEFLHSYLEEAGMLDAVFCREAFRLTECNGETFPSGKWLEINELMGALRPARESRAGSAALGQNLLAAVLPIADCQTLRDAWQAARSARAAVYHSTAFGLIAGALGIDEEFMVLGFLHQTSASLVSACQRLMPIGQSEATRILWMLKPVIIATAARSRQCGIEEVSCFMPLPDWGAMEHPALSTRLFIS